MSFEQWWAEYTWDDTTNNGIKKHAKAAWEAAVRNLRTENDTFVMVPPSSSQRGYGEITTSSQAKEREVFITRVKCAGYAGMQEYITAQAQMYNVPLDVARSCFQIGSYPEAFTGFIDELKKYKLTKKGAVTCYQT